MPALQLNQLPLQVYVFAGILGLLFLFFIMRFVLRGVVLNVKLSRLAKQIRKVGAEGGDPAPLFESDKALKHLFQEFRKTLHEQMELNPRTGEMERIALRPTVPAEMYFNTQALVDNRLGTEFFKHLPGIFTGVGIIGTFLGLILGLQAFQVSEAPSVVRTSLNSLLHGVWEAFLVSAAAITLAMVVTVIEKLLLASLYRKVEELNQALDSQLQAGAGEEYLSRLVKASEEGAAQTKILKDALVADLKQVLSELTERQIAAMHTGNVSLGQAIGSHIEASLQKPLEEIARATGGLREDQGSAVTRLLTDVMAGFSEQLQGLFGGQIASINQLQQETIKALQTTVTHLAQTATEVQVGGTRVTDAMTERLNQATMAMESRQEALNGRLGSFLEQMREQSRDSQAEANQKLHETLDALGAKVGHMVASLQMQNAQAAATHAEREERVAIRAEHSMAQVGSQVDSVLAAVANASGEMATAVMALQTGTTESLRQIAAEVQASGNKATNAMAERLSQAMTAMEARQEALNRHMGNFLEQVRRQTLESSSETDKKLRDILDTLGVKVGEMVANLQSQATEATASHTAREERAAQRNEESLNHLGGQVDSVITAVAQASTEMANSVAALRAVTTESIEKMATGAETLYIAASDFAKAGQSVSGVLVQATTVAGHLAQAGGAVATATHSLDGALTGYKATSDVIARMVTELQGIVVAAKKEASLTTGILQHIDTAAGKLGKAQLDVEAYLGRVSGVLAEAHQSFTKGMQQSVRTANTEFYTELSKATNLLSDGIKELELVLSDITVKA